MTLHKMDHTNLTGCPRCKYPMESFLHLALSCPLILDFCSKVLDRVHAVIHVPCALKPTFCLLGDLQGKKGQKISLKFLQLLFLLAKPRVAITWMGDAAPIVDLWERDVAEWAVAEEVRMKLCRTDNKVGDDRDVGLFDLKIAGPAGGYI